MRNSYYDDHSIIDSDDVQDAPQVEAVHTPLKASLAYVFLWPSLEAFLKRLNIDTTKILDRYTIAVAFLAGWQYIMPYLCQWTLDMATCSVVVSNEHDNVNDIRKWLTEHTAGSGQNHVNIQLGRIELRKDSTDLKHEIEKHCAARSTFFRFGGTLLYFERVDVDRPDSRRQKFGQWESGTGPEDKARISTLRFGGGQNVLADFMQDVMERKRAKGNTTTVYAIEQNEGFGAMDLIWSGRARPSRLMDTIDLDQSVKADLIKDFETFVGPDRGDWYTERGIPYYRDYLFQGPPGTGKSSTAFALACLRHNCLYTLSLKEISNEIQLRQLFRVPRKGDILLLEDIDTAGIRREKMEAVFSKDVQTYERDEIYRPRRSRKREPLTLAALLDAIDTARKSGVLLIMTSNKPETLDAALVRAGRIDKTIYFGKATKVVAGKIFQRMYKDFSACTRTWTGLTSIS